MASLVLDSRERELIALMPTCPSAQLPVSTSSITVAQLPVSTSSITVAQLPVGDIWIGSPETNEYAVVVERKAVADLESSLSDGRYREQRTRLLAFCAE